MKEELKTAMQLLNDAERRELQNYIARLVALPDDRRFRVYSVILREERAEQDQYRVTY